jgi:ribosomal protein S18 acetylase RimI-like enzyme
MSDKLERMIALANEFFETKNDPEQLDVNEEVMGQLYSLHPSTINEYVVDGGPVCWILLIPSSIQTMDAFLSGKIGEKEILKQSLAEKKFEAIYLCSALVLPEFRKQGIAHKLSYDAIQNMKKNFQVKHLYAWPFSEDGEKLAQKISKEVGIGCELRK